MAHNEQINFFLRVKKKLPQFFVNCDVVDIGSLDINGNNRYLFDNYTYTGVDIGEGANVDVVSKGHLYRPNKQFDVVISSECFEHDFFYKETLRNCVLLTKSGGLFTFTCASTGRHEHGTKRTGSQACSPFSCEEWDDHYKNLTEQDVRESIDVDAEFSQYAFEYLANPGDLYFWGIKK